MFKKLIISLITIAYLILYGFYLTGYISTLTLFSILIVTMLISSHFLNRKFNVKKAFDFKEKFKAKKKLYIYISLLLISLALYLYFTEGMISLLSGIILLSLLLFYEYEVEDEDKVEID